MNQTNTVLKLKLPCQYQQFYIGIILSTIVLLLNTLTTVTIWQNHKFHTSNSVFIVSRALIDGLMGVSGLAQSILYSPLLKMGPIKLLDNITLGISYASVVLSCTHIALAAIDRYVCMAHPFYYIANVTKAYLLRRLTFIWLMGFVYLILPAFLYTDDTYHQKCILVHPPSEYYIASIVISSVNYITVFVCYSKIAHLAFQHNKAANKRRLQNENDSEAIRLENNYKAAMRSLKFFVVLFGTYLMFTFPQTIAMGLLFLSYQIPDYVIVLMYGLSQIHSVINFFIHLNMSKDFSEAVKKQVINLCCILRNRQAD